MQEFSISRRGLLHTPHSASLAFAACRENAAAWKIGFCKQTCWVCRREMPDIQLHSIWFVQGRARVRSKEKKRELHVIVPPRKQRFECMRISNKLRKKQCREATHWRKNQSKEQIPLSKTQTLPHLAGRRLSRTTHKTVSHCRYRAAKRRRFPISKDLRATEGTSLRKAEPTTFHYAEL